MSELTKSLERALQDISDIKNKEKLCKTTMMKVKIPNGYIIVKENNGADDLPGISVMFSETGNEDDWKMIVGVGYNADYDKIETELYSE